MRISLKCKVWSFHGGDYEECRFLGGNTGGSSSNWCFVGTYRHYQQSEKNGELGEP
jgi:hypothetical protein